MKKTNLIISLLKGTLVAVGFTVIGVAALALFAKDAEGSSLKIFALAIKIISIVLGVVVSAMKIRKRGAVVGASVACAYWILSLLLSILVEPLSLSVKMAGDLLLSCIMGGLAGILTVNALK